MAITLDGTSGMTLPGTSTGVQVGSLTSGTTQTTTSGTSINFTGIPSWAKKVTIMLSGVSTNGSDNLLVQIGTSSSVETTGYLSTLGVMNSTTAATATSTAGFLVSSQTAARVASGIVTLAHMGSNLWVLGGTVKSDTTVIAMSAGEKTLSGVLDRVRLTSTGGTNTFDAGSMNIMYE